MRTPLSRHVVTVLNQLNRRILFPMLRSELAVTIREEPSAVIASARLVKIAWPPSGASVCSKRVYSPA